MLGAIAGDIIGSVYEHTHNHPEGVAGAQAIAASVFLARTGNTKPQIREFAQNTWGYDLDMTLEEVRNTHTWDVSCRGTVPPALIAFLESENWEDAVRKA